MPRASELITQSYLNGEAGLGQLPAPFEIRFDEVDAQLADIVTIKSADTATVQAIINSSAGATLTFSSETFNVTGLTFPNNSHVVFNNTKFVRTSGNGLFLSFGENCVLEGKVEIDGNKSGIPAAAKNDIGLSLGAASVCTAEVYAHDCGGHGIILASYCSIYSPKSNNNGLNPGPSGTGDGIYMVNANRTNVLNAQCSGNARNNYTATTFVSDALDPTYSVGVIISNSYSSGAGYVGIDIEGVSYCTVNSARGWDSISSSSSTNCVFFDIECSIFYANNHANCSVDLFKCRPTGAASNVFFLSGVNARATNGRIFDTASSYTSNTLQVVDTVSKNAYVANIIVEKGNNSIVVSDPSTLFNCTAVTSLNRPMIIVRNGNSSYPVVPVSVRITNGVVEMSHTAAPATGYWSVGDRNYRPNAAAAGKIGDVCTTAGTPGTWKGWGAIDA